MKKLFVALAAASLIASVGVAEAKSKKSSGTVTTATGQITGAGGISGKSGNAVAGFAAGAISVNTAEGSAKNGKAKSEANSSTASGSAAGVAGSGNSAAGALSGSFGIGGATVSSEAKKN